MKKYSCIAVDDDFVALKIVESLVDKVEFLDYKGGFHDATDGANAVQTMKPDILFLDVQMPGLSGIDILKNLKDMPEVILVTSQAKFALEAFEFQVTDYLLKPIENYARFLKAVTRAAENISKKPAETPAASSESSFFVKTDSLLVNLDIRSIGVIEAYGDYVKIHAGDKTHVVYTKMKAVEERLPSNDFVRVHRSYIVRIDKIKNIDQGNLQVGDKVIPVSNSCRPALLGRIQML